MRFKRQKRHRKVVKFFTTCFGFRQPFKVLCDGTFIHHVAALEISISPPNDAVSNVLGARAKLFTTKCIIAELRSLGESYSESFRLAHTLSVARCEHEKRKSATACIQEVIGKDNAEHFFVASMDAELRQKLQEIPGVPVIFGLRKALYLEQPSKVQRQFIRSCEQKRLHMTDLEREILNRSTKSKFSNEGTIAPDDADGLLDQSLESIPRGASTVRKSGDAKDRPQFRRKKPQAPNPLSCKKKKRQEQPQKLPNKEDKNGNSSERKERKRKRSRSGKKLQVPDS